MKINDQIGCYKLKIILARENKPKYSKQQTMH